MRTRDRAAELDFSEVLSEEVETEMKEAAAISMGTDISESDILNILALCEQERPPTLTVPGHITFPRIRLAVVEVLELAFGTSSARYRARVSS